MSLSLQTNMGALSAQRNLFNNGQSLQQAYERLSSGYRITRASNDAAGLGVAANLYAQIRSFHQAIRNSLDGVSVAQVAEGALSSVHSNLSRMRELAMQAASSGISDSERAYAQAEFSQLRSEIDRVGKTTEFNNVKLLDDSSGSKLSFQVGVRDSSNDRIEVETVDLINDTNYKDLWNDDISTAAGAQAALDTIDSMINEVSSWRSAFGVTANRFEQATRNAQSAAESLAAAHSRIRDVNVAAETSRLASMQVQQMAGVSILAQANLKPLNVLELI